jgi:electron transfer flavoprotein alpha subunit
VKKISYKNTVQKYKGVWVLGEIVKEEVHPVVFELLSKGREMAMQVKEELGVVVLGYKLEKIVQKLANYGVDKVYMVEDEGLKDFNLDPYTTILFKLVSKYKPSIFLAGGTTFGRTLFPRLAVRLKTGLTADCTQLTIQNNLLVQTRPAFGGNLMATILCQNRRPQMATVRYKVLERKEKVGVNKGKIIREKITPNMLYSRTKVVKFIDTLGESVSLEDANIIVAGGSGLGSKENFKLIYQLAETLGGVVGASRPVVERGWVSYFHQIGQTGKTVRPQIYIACAISGAIQHLAGMVGAKNIIAINKDPYAPIFKVADVGIVGDVFEVLPMIIDKLKR